MLCFAHHCKRERGDVEVVVFADSMVAVTDTTPTGKGLVVLTPLLQGTERNVVRISRMSELDKSDVHHIAGGEHTGIIVNKMANATTSYKCDVTLSFSVWISDGVNKKQENRQLRFRFYDDVDSNQKHALAQQVFKELVGSFLKDYVTFLKRILKLMQGGYSPLREIELDMQFAKKEEAIQMPDITEYESGSEVESVTAAHVQDVLEHAYPNGLSLQLISEALRCTKEEAEEFLHELELLGVVQKLQDEWIRVDTRKGDEGKASGAGVRDRHSPTVAIITCLFVEKQCVDAVIDNSTTVHRYRSGGDSNVYTLGWIGPHRVVATKLAVIGDSREATTSAGSITTRLLGNFQDVEHVFIVGVGGGVAHYTDALRHIRLGDVVVSNSSPDAYSFAHSYTLDRHTDSINGFVLRRWNPKDDVIARLASQGNDGEVLNEWNSLTDRMLTQLGETNADVEYRRPPPEKDLLTLPVGGGNVVMIPHPNQDRTQSKLHLGAVGGMATFKKPTTNEEGDETRDGASQLRERFAGELGLRAVDAGFDSVIAAINGSRIDSWALIRGIADYHHGQSRAARTWQAYASVRAAAMTRVLIERLPAVVNNGNQ